MVEAALVLGAAETLWDDVLRLEEDVLRGPWTGPVVAVNDVGTLWPRRLDHWVTLHYEKMPGWVEAREERRFPGPWTTWGRKGCNRWPEDTTLGPPGWGGSSGLLGVQVALSELRIPRVVLCGIPMTATPYTPHSTESHFTDDAGRWRHADKHWKRWMQKDVRRYITPLVRSMSGRTRDTFGEPTREWVLRGIAKGPEVESPGPSPSARRSAG